MKTILPLLASLAMSLVHAENQNIPSYIAEVFQGGTRIIAVWINDRTNQIICIQGNDAVKTTHVGSLPRLPEGYASSQIFPRLKKGDQLKALRVNDFGVFSSLDNHGIWQEVYKIRTNVEGQYSIMVTNNPSSFIGQSTVCSE